jgi:hypothetical protein
VRDFNSFHYEIETLDDWLVALKAHSARGHCFLKGELDRKLEGESRAGRTDANKATYTYLLDLDFNDGFRDIEHFLATLDPRFEGVSYIVQHSNSAGIKGRVGLRAHIMFLSTVPLSPSLIKLWLQKKNLDTPELRRRITLSANGMSLKYPLDVTTCQNDKIIYVARPITHGFVDPLADSRIELINKDKPAVTQTLPMINPAQVQEKVDNLVTELRNAAGLKKKTHKYAKNTSGVLLNPDMANVTGIRVTSDFTYLNLNGGDSWAYYHNTKKPDLLWNFKGEPAVRLKDIAPEYYESEVKKRQTEQEQEPLVFRERRRDAYYNCRYNPNTNDIDSLDPVSSREKMEDFMKQYGADLPDPIEDWRVEFDPRTNEVLSKRHKWINSFRPTKFMKTDFEPVPRIPMVIDRVLTSICVDAEYKAFFINWLAYMFQFREKTVVCPIFHGVQGTGKGLLQEKILKPLFGYEHTPKLTTQTIKSEFNAWIEHALIAVWDEAQQDSAFDSTVYDKAKYFISEHHITLRLMRTNPLEIRNFVNLMVFTNHPYPFPLERGDRRFSPAPAQMDKLEISKEEVALIEDELEMFAAFLQHYQVDSARARRVLENKARTDMINGSANTVDAFFYNLREGHLDYFLGFVRQRAALTPENTYVEFERTLKRWCNDALNTTTQRCHTIVTRDEAMAVYSYVIKPFHSPAKFRKMGDKYHIKSGRGYINGKQTRGWAIVWQIEDMEEAKAFIEPSVSELKAV